MSKTVRIIVYVLLGIFFFSTFVSLFSRCEAGDGNEKPPASSPPASSPSTSTPGEEEDEDESVTEESYSIVYYAIIDGGEPKAIPDSMYNANGSYPTSYLSANGATVDDLRDYGNYEFQGWYFDEECETPFDGTIDIGTTGHIELYAKIIDLNNDIYWTPNY